MKRFYTQVDIQAEGDGQAEGDSWQVVLDGRAVRTPARAPLLLPTQVLAEVIAAEWRVQGENIDPASMTATGFANAAIDQVMPDPDAFAADIARYGESDLLCYRADAPQPLVTRQAAQWDRWLDWARGRYDVAFRVTRGIIPVAQPPETLARLSATVAARDPFTLAGLATLVSLTGSLVLGLALIDADADAETIWQAAELDLFWQVEQWGEDVLAQRHAEERRRQFDAAVAFCALLPR